MDCACVSNNDSRFALRKAQETTLLMHSHHIQIQTSCALHDRTYSTNCDLLHWFKLKCTLVVKCDERKGSRNSSTSPLDVVFFSCIPWRRCFLDSCVLLVWCCVGRALFFVLGRYKTKRQHAATSQTSRVTQPSPAP